MAILLNEGSKFKLLYYDDNFQECNELFETQTKAEKRKKELLEKYPLYEQITGDWLVIDFLNSYITNVVAIKKSHRQYLIDKGLVLNYISICIDGMKINDINKDISWKILEQLESLPVHEKSKIKDSIYVSEEVVYKCFRLLLNAFRLLYINEVIDNNPFENMDVKRNKSNDRISNKWTVTLFEEMLEKCSESDLFVFIHLLFNTQLPIRELRALEISNVYISDSFMNQTKCYIESTQYLERVSIDAIDFIKDDVIEIIEPKQSNSKRTKTVLIKKKESTKIMLPNTISSLLLEYIDLVRYIHHKNDSKHQFLFPNIEGDPIDDRTLSKKFDLIKPGDGFTFKNLSSFAAKKTQYSIGEMYYYQLDEKLKLPATSYKDRKTDIDVIYHDKNNDDFIKKVEAAIPSEENINVNAFIEFLNSHEEFKIQLLHKIKELI